MFNLTKTRRSWRQSANWCWSRSSKAAAKEVLRAPRVLESRRRRDTQRSSRSHTARISIHIQFLYIRTRIGDKRTHLLTHARKHTKLQQCGRFSFIFFISLLLFSFRACACVCVRVCIVAFCALTHSDRGRLKSNNVHIWGWPITTTATTIICTAAASHASKINEWGIQHQQQQQQR